MSASPLRDPTGDDARALVVERERRRRELDEAVAAVPEPSLAASLQRVAEKIPAALEVELASIRVRASDDPRELHLVAAAGSPSDDVRRLARRPLTIPRARTLLAAGAAHSLARHLSLVWLHGAWVRRDAEAIGLIIVGTRTERRPMPADVARLEHVAERLTEPMASADRRTRRLRLIGVEIARDLLPPDPYAALTSATAVLRPRERAVLELYADGLSTREIADVLVISPHTVRTHVKLALRRLGVHSRRDAERLIAEQRVETLL